MRRNLEYTLCRTYQGEPLVTLDSPLGNGQELSPARLEMLAYTLLKIAAEAARHETVGKHYRNRKGNVQF
ncbi:hypothetical protein [Paraburkholderia kururiensis]|uniref:hypothetical protein n=1 Tax=Paraburkholderia kururiensis TaxID=984307 RepID=UPI0012E096A9|nr:hypothetical protein [Paraburkholderia kururiensis]